MNLYGDDGRRAYTDTRGTYAEAMPQMAQLNKRSDTLTSSIEEMEKLSMELNAMVKDLAKLIDPICTPEPETNGSAIAGSVSSCPAVAALSRIAWGMRETQGLVASLTRRVMI